MEFKGNRFYLAKSRVRRTSWGNNRCKGPEVEELVYLRASKETRVSEGGWEKGVR